MNRPSRLGLAIIGGGWAGLAAAIEATRRGHQVTLFEMAPTLGGRARSVDIDEPVLDNGQHILIGAYRETLRLMRTIDVDPDASLLRGPLTLVDAEGVGLRLPEGPALLAFGRGVLSHKGWTVRDRVALLTRAVHWARIGFTCRPDLTVSALCIDLPSAVQRDLIEPLCVAALNTPASQASARVFLRVLRDAMFSGRGSADLLLPRLPLGDLFPAPAARWLQKQGARVCTSRRVINVNPDSEGWSVDGERFDGVVLACTASEAARLVQSHAPQWAEQAASFRYEPIVTVYAVSPGTRLPQPMTLLRSGLTDGPAQFVFDHGWLSGRHGLLSFVISAAQPWIDSGAEAAANATFAQARSQLSTQLKAPLQALRVFNEKRATFRCTPDLQRPPPLIAPGLFAAGDYIEGPYPSTLEGAVQSGVSAASNWRI
ncbi:MAG: hydroxysqualene dehydroxylase HpnE [Burkholderiaceae bacterium]|nr:hydroxysqualene dehydroxylase HpnE [Burkholderiaceae bacterium]